ncbi:MULTISPECIES: YdcH family protein [Rhizobium]|uniref:DUF465 domain-containing protein n=1 Tax=Rhizobium rhododendri TaxID=2506430 RepID=A0ABY8IE26_9HYPH|nr:MULTISPECIES: DUF465 domain-containing protein [Rhizobium]MBO9099683.1 DUF465 domain-containing protein [Rhizobium sp. L58/93]MBO9131785.1 DUF465 domain-containing protein [Rhizobium sp. B209b/85]MBO9169673.1 DUF465 domain-containing protein [Rhizobium sp. L245/93]MBO9185631.1 DUF465 domain-containing protein [Rhizobium sp. E27B/91]MBZ5759048.1 DUF465 domain-containing protein [Rhizobium sp. VS19-DR96]
MTVQAHLESLQKKHVALEEKLHSAMTSPSVDDREIADIKRMKLKIKDQIQRIATSVH